MSDKKGRLYFDLIQSFWIAQRHFGLSAGSVSLYFYLLNCFNSARWPKELGISSNEIQLILGISKRTFYKFKEELCSIKAIEVDFALGRIKQTYQLNVPKISATGVDYVQPSASLSAQPSAQPSAENAPTYYIDKNKNKDLPPKSPPQGDRLRNKEAEEIYKAYPRKVAKPVALRAIKKHLSKVGFIELMNKTEAFAKAVEGSDPQYIPHPSTFYNQERFNDDPTEWVPAAETVKRNPQEPHKPQMSGPQRVMLLQDQIKQLKEEMRTYRLAHRSEMAMGVSWDAGTKEKYLDMKADLERYQSRLKDLI